MVRSPTRADEVLEKLRFAYPHDNHTASVLSERIGSKETVRSRQLRSGSPVFDPMSVSHQRPAGMNGNRPSPALSQAAAG